MFGNSPVKMVWTCLAIQDDQKGNCAKYSARVCIPCLTACVLLLMHGTAPMPKNYPVGVKATLPPRSKTHENIGLQKKWSKGKLFRIKFWTTFLLTTFSVDQYFHVFFELPVSGLARVDCRAG